MHLLIIHEGTKSEILMSTPLIRALHTEKNADLTLIVKEENKHLLQGNPHLKHCLSISEYKHQKNLQNAPYEYVICLKQSWKTKLYTSRIKGRKLAFKDSLSWLFLKLRIGSLHHEHLSMQYLRLAKPLGVVGDNEGLDFFIPEKDEVENSWLPETHRAGFALIAVAAKKDTQKLPLNRLIELCDRINKPIVLIGEEEDRHVCQEVVKFFEPGTAEEEKEIEKLHKKAVIFNACEKFNFNQKASLIAQSNWVFTYDNVFMHLASAFQKPLYTIWGSSSPLFGTYPFQAKFTVFENKKLKCRPCSKVGFGQCPKGHFKCMNEVTFDFYLPD